MLANTHAKGMPDRSPTPPGVGQHKPDILTFFSTDRQRRLLQSNRACDGYVKKIQASQENFSIVAIHLGCDNVAYVLANTTPTVLPDTLGVAQHCWPTLSA